MAKARQTGSVLTWVIYGVSPKDSQIDLLLPDPRSFDFLLQGEVFACSFLSLKKIKGSKAQQIVVGRLPEIRLFPSYLKLG